MAMPDVDLGKAQTEINALDLAFVVDTTGSMRGLIAAAQRQMITMLDALSRTAGVAMRLGVVEYRDHPPQDPLVYRAHGLTADLATARKTIDGLEAAGGGDTPESVLDGVLATCRELKWREHARRIAVLVGDSPPHGVGAHGDGFPRGCPCGETIESVTAAAEEARVTFYALGLTHAVTESFTRLSTLTGGEFFAAGSGDAALDRLRALLEAEFGALDFDRRVLEAWNAQPGVALDELATALGSSRPAVSAALSRLGARRLLEVAAPVGQR
jgi:hypothetical protein